jgi:hypothetical protein
VNRAAASQPTTNTDVINFKAGPLIDTKQAAIQRAQQRKLAAENKAKMLAASGTSLYVKLIDGQEMIADFANCKFEGTEEIVSCGCCQFYNGF